MNYGYVKEGQILRVGLPNSFISEDGAVTTGMHLLAESDLNAMGWYSIYQEMPEYDPSTQMIVQKSYAFDGTRIAAGFDVYPLPEVQINPEEMLRPSAEEVAKAEREIETLNLLIELGVIV